MASSFCSLFACRSRLLAVGLSLGLWVAAASAQKIEFVEDFVLAADRQGALQQLVPGTEDYFYYHALDQQLRGQYGPVESWLEQWIEKHGVTARVKELQLRQALLRYPSQPRESLDFIVQTLGLRFEHQRRIPPAEQQLASRLDVTELDVPRLLDRALREQPETNGLETAGLELLGAKWEQLNRVQRRSLLGRLSYPDFPQLLELITDDLRQPDRPGFGSVPIHNQLTLVQLEQLAETLPQLLNEQGYVQLYCRKLLPGADVNLAAQPEEELAYLNRVSRFVSRLAAGFNSLKAAVLFRLLDLERRQGKFDRVRFLEYLKLPRRQGHLNPRLWEQVLEGGQLVDLNASFEGVTRCPPIGDELPLVREFLQHFLREESGVEAFAPFFNEEFLKREFAVTKILSGQGDPQRWAAVLSPDEYKELLERVELDFAPGNPERVAVADLVKLRLRLKNVPRLIIKVFEINTENFYRETGREIGTDINLDGLVANWEMAFEYAEPPALRMEREFEFPQLSKRGVYVIDFIGAGLSSRALVRKGELSFVQQVRSTGQELIILDEEGQVCSQADVWLQGRRFSADQQGRVLLPFSTQPGAQTLVLRHEGFCALATWEHLSEDYRLVGGIYVDRESLLRSRAARVLVRPSLKLSGFPVPLGQRLQNVQLQVDLTNQDGQSSAESFADLKLDERGEATCEFQVPPRLAALRLTLTAQIRCESQNNEQRLELSQSLTVNQVNRTDEFADLHLLRSGSEKILEVRGLNGEVRSQVAVQLELKHRLFTQPLQKTLQSDELGVVFLGDLPGVEWIRGTLPGGTPRTWSLQGGNVQTPLGNLHGLAGESLHMLVPPAVREKSDVSLFEIHDGLIVAERSQWLSLEQELLTLESLPAGDYQLLLKPVGQLVSIRITAGREVAGVLRGKQRTLEVRDQSVLRLEQTSVNEESVALKLAGFSDSTRVHVFASRFAPRFDAGLVLGQVRDLEPAVYRHAVRANAYLSGRVLGEEFQYILMRQMARKFPGVQLARPSLLLNPWSLGPTDNRERVLAGGGDFGNVVADAPAEQSRQSDTAIGAAEPADFSNLDFLSQGSKVFFNLRPDAEGRITIPRDGLGNKQHLVVVLVDLFQTVERTLVLPAAAAETRDLRLVNALEPSKEVSLQQAVTPLQVNQSFQIEDLLTAKFSLYDDLGDIFSLCSALAGTAVLDEFKFLIRWGDLPLEEKKTFYSRHASHELHFFLARKDPEFFRQVVRPLLENKLEKAFVDRWLLDEPLETYLEPWRFERLNAFEKVLLAKRLPQQRERIARLLSERRAIETFSRDELNRLFASALFGNPDTLPEGYLKKKEELESKGAESLRRNAANMPRPAGGGGGGRGGFAAGAPGAPPATARPELAGKSLEPQAGAGLAFGRELAAGESQLEKDGRADRNELALGDKVASSERQQSQAVRFRDQFFDADLPAAEPEDRFYQRIRPTEEWVESNYYRLSPSGPSTTELLPLNDFWLDWLAAGEEDGASFCSPNFLQLFLSGREAPERLRSATLLALALLDLPFEAQPHQVEYQDSSVSWKLSGPAIMFHEQIRGARRAEQGTAILVSENFFQKADRYRMEGGLRYDRFLSGQYSIQDLYGAQVVITNPTSTPRVVQLVYQIPQGAMATSGTQETRTIPLELGAFSTQSFEYFFYFPAAGKFRHFPAQVAAGKEILAVAPVVEFEVGEEPESGDPKAWAYVSQNGTPAEVLAYLNQANLFELNLEEIAFRMRDAEFFKEVIHILRERQFFSPTLWSYALFHNSEAEIREYLGQREDLLVQCGKYLDSRLVTINPLDRGWYEQREYWPLIPSRIHPVGNRREILNPSIHRQYHRLLQLLSYRPSLSSDDQLKLVYYLLLQDRYTEALDWFARIQPADLASRLQYDYCQAYLHLVAGNSEAAKVIVAQYREYPVEHWQQRFEAMHQQIVEIQGGVAALVNPDDPAQVQAAAADRAESFQFRIEKGMIELEYRQLKEVTLNLYAMDVELSFSRNPFASGAEDGFSMIRPNHSQRVELAADSGRQSIELPESFRNRNLLVELRSQEQTRSLPVYANNLNVQFREAFGELQVANLTSGAVLPVTYVKVYGQRADGTAVFVKDGYTDLRGRFDYVTQSNVPLDGMEKLAVLVLHPQEGTLIRIVGMPKE